MATLVDSYTVLPTSDATSLYNASTYDSVGQSFDSGAGGDISTAKCYCHTNGSPTGSVYAKLYAHSGTFGTSSVGTGAALATSDAVDITTIGSVDEWVEFTFTSTYEMTASTKYVIMFYYQGGDSSNKLWVMGEGTTASHGGNRIRHTAADAWSYNAANECLFEVYSKSGGGGGSSAPTVNGVSTPSAINGVSNAVTIDGVTGS